MRSYSSYANSEATMIAQSKPPSTPTISASEEESLILKALHAETKEDFRNAIDCLIDPDERRRLQKAEENGLLLQSAAMLDQIVRQRLPRRLAELIGWKIPEGLAEVVEPAKDLAPKLRVVTLRLFGSRGLDGPVALRVIQSVAKVSSPFPASVLASLTEMLEMKYFRQVAYLEPLFHEGRVLTCQNSVRRFKCKPRDPILTGFLGSGPPGYGYDLRNPIVWELFKKREYKNQPAITVLVIAHW